METSFLCLTLTSLLFCSTHQVRLTVSPSRSQMFEFESVTLTCEDESSSAGWTVMRKIDQNQFKCGDEWGKPTGLSCSIRHVLVKDTGVYWCESTSGSSIISSSMNLSVGGSVILQSPVLPVMEGHDVTLSCRAKNQPHNLPAAFYKDGSFIGKGSSGNFTLKQLKKSDEGHYKCSISGQGESPSSWISVEGQKFKQQQSKPTVAPPTSTSKAPPPASNPFQLVFTVMRHLLVFCPYIISTLLFLSLCQHRSPG